MTPITTNGAADMGHRKEVKEHVSYAEFVAGICKPGKDILITLTPDEAHVIHMMLGVVGEVGELVDALKKSVIYRKPLDRENTIEEMGDIEFYLQGLRNGLSIPRDLTIIQNVTKLRKRYASGTYSNTQAIERADKAIVQDNK